MSSLVSHAATFRRGGYQSLTYASVLPYTVVLVGSISALPTFPSLTVAYTVSSGTYSNVKIDQLVVFYSSTGVRKGSTRVAYGTVTSTSLPISELSANSINIVAGDTFKVFDAYEIRDKLVSATAEFLKDSRIALGSNTSNPPPVANTGGLWAGWVDVGEIYATVSFDASTSFALDMDSSGALTYSWSVGDGTIVTGSTSTAVIAVQFPVGFRHISLTVTDASNSVTHTKRVPVWVHDDTYLPLSLSIQELRSNLESGWAATFELPIAAQSHIDTLPDGALIVIWEDEYYNGTKASYGNAIASRAHIKATLYLLRDTVTIDAVTNTVIFEAVSPLEILKLTPALAQLMIYADSPTAWSQVRGLTVNRMFHYLAHWHSNVLMYFDFHWISGVDMSYARVSVDAGSLGDQLKDIAFSVNALVTCDTMGTLRILNDPNYLSLELRDERTTTYNLADGDIVEVSFANEHRGTVKHVRGQGLSGDSTVAGTQAVFSNAGNAPSWMGVQYETFGKQILNGANAQADLNKRTGLHFAKLNSLYNGRFVPKAARLTLPDGYHVFDPALLEFVTLALDDSTNGRGSSFNSDTRWLITEMAVAYDNGSKSVTLTLAHETYGADGVAYYPPTSDTSLPPYNPPPPPVYNPPPPNNIGLPPTTELLPNFAYFTASNELVRTSDFDTPSWDGSPTWTVTNIGTLTGWPYPSGTLHVVAFAVDMASPKYLGTGTTINGWLVTDAKVMVISDIFGTPVISNIVDLCGATSPAAQSTDKRTIHVERLRPHFAAIASVYDDGTVWVAVTTNGTTWTEEQIGTGYNDALDAVPSVYVDPSSPNTIYVSVFRSGIVSGDNYQFDATTIYRSTDGGATWSEYYSPRLAQGVHPHIITKATSDPTRIFYGVNKFGNPESNYTMTYDPFIDPRSTWSFTLDFTTSPHGFYVVPETYELSSYGGKWVAGQGWVATIAFRQRSPYYDGKWVQIAKDWDTPVDWHWKKVSTVVVAKTGYAPIGGSYPTADPYASPRWEEYYRATHAGAETGEFFRFDCDIPPFSTFNASLPENASVSLAITSVYYEGQDDNPFLAYLGQAGGGLAWRKGAAKAEISPTYDYQKYIPFLLPHSLSVLNTNSNAALLCAMQLNPDFDFEYGSKGWRAGNSYTNWVASLDDDFPYGGFKPATGQDCWVRYQLPAAMTIMGIRFTGYGIISPNDIIISTDAAGTDIIEDFTDVTGSVLWTDATVGDITMCFVELAETEVPQGTYIHIKLKEDAGDTSVLLHVQFVSQYTPTKYGVFLSQNATGSEAVWTNIAVPSSSVAWREGYLQTATTGIVTGIAGKIGRLEGGFIDDRTGNSTASGDVIGVVAK